MNRDKEKDVERLANAFYENLTVFNCEFGGIGLNPKRPFGNGCVEADILEIIGWEPEGRNEDEDEGCYTFKQKEYARSLYFDDLIPYLKSKWFDVHGEGE